MGYNLSNGGKKAFMGGALQSASLAVTLADGTTMTLTGANIRQGGLTIDRRTVTGEDLVIGAAMASELTVVLDNYSGAFSSADFMGAVISVTVSVTAGGTTYSVPMGVFTIDNITSRRYAIELYGLDNMTKFDKAMDLSAFTFPMTINQFIQRICLLCGVTLATDLSAFIGNAYNLETAPVATAEYSYRQYLTWALQYINGIAYADWDGELRVVSFGHVNDSADLWRGDFFVYAPAPFRVAYNGKVTQTSRSTDWSAFDGYRAPITLPYSDDTVQQYTLCLSNEMIIHQHEVGESAGPSAAHNKDGFYLGVSLDGSHLYGMTPMQSEALPLPWVWPGDVIKIFSDATYMTMTAWTMPTSVTFSLNGRTKICCTASAREYFDEYGTFILNSQTTIPANMDAVINNKLTAYLPQDNSGNVEITGNLTLDGLLSLASRGEVAATVLGGGVLYNTDLDTATIYSGVYWVRSANGNTNIPNNYGNGFLVAFSNGASDKTGVQFFVPYSNGDIPRLYVRSYINSAWTSWKYAALS